MFCVYKQVHSKVPAIFPSPTLIGGKGAGAQTVGRSQQSLIRPFCVQAYDKTSGAGRSGHVQKVYSGECSWFSSHMKAAENSLQALAQNDRSFWSNKIPGGVLVQCASPSGRKEGECAPAGRVLCGDVCEGGNFLRLAGRVSCCKERGGGSSGEPVCARKSARDKFEDVNCGQYMYIIQTGGPL